MPTFAGLRGTGNFATDERPKNFREGILRLNPEGSAPLFALMSMMNEQSIDDPEHSWFEEKNRIIRNQITGAGLSATSTVITLTATTGDDPNGLDYVAGDIVVFETTQTSTYNNEIAVVSSVESATQITVKRGQHGTTAAATAAGTFFTKVGNRFAEGTGAPSISLRNPVKLTNYTQIFKHTYGDTGTAIATRTRTGNPLKNDRLRKMFDHSNAIEFSLLFGKPSEDLTGGSNGKPLRTMGGLMNFITTNRSILGGTPSLDTLVDALVPVFDDVPPGTPNERIVLGGKGAFMYLNRLIRDETNTRINFDNSIKVYGMKLQLLQTPHGDFGFKTHPLFTNHSWLNNAFVVVNPRALTYMPLKGRDTREKKNVQLPDEDQTKNMFLTECTLEVAFEETMAYIGGVGA